MKYTRPELKIRGWTDGMIKRWLGEHDDTKPNWRYPHAAPPTRLWSVERVHKAEALPDWQAAHAKLEASKERRKASAAKAVATKEAKLLAEIAAWNPEIYAPEGMTAEQLICDALDSKRHLESSRGRDFYTRPDGYTSETLVRWAENYVRHELTSYDSAFFAQSGCSVNHDLIRDRVNNAVHKRWPNLYKAAILMGSKPQGDS